MSCLKRPSWLGALIIIVALFSFPQAVSANYSPSSFYDWGNYYQPKVLALTAYAQESTPSSTLPANFQVPTTSYLLPDSPFYFTKTWTENIQTTFTFGDEAKSRRYLDLAEERLAETLSLAQKGKYDLARHTAERYQNSLETLNTRLQSAPNSLQGGELEQKLETFATQTLLISQNSLTASSPNNTDIFRQVLSSSQNLADNLADIQKEPAIPDDLANSLQTLKSQGLLTAEESDKLYSLKSRTDVRGELEKLASEGLFPPSEIVTLNQVVKDSYPDQYTSSYNYARFNELRSYESYPRPDSELSTKLADFRKNYQEGEPIPGELRPYIVYVRLEDLAKKVDLNALPEGAEKELRSFYPESTNVNPTATLPDTPLTIGAPSGENVPASNSAPEATTEENQPEAGENTQKIDAQTYLGKPSGFLPDSPFYFVKSFQEGWTNTFTFDREEQIKLDIQHAQERLREADSLFTAGKENLGTTYLKNYTTAIKKVAEDIERLPDTNKEAIPLATRFEDQVAKANIVLERSLIPVPETQTNEVQKAIVATQDSLDSASDAQNKAPVPRILADRLQDLKSTGILLPEEVTKIIQANSRIQVREIVRELEDKGVFPPADSKKLDIAEQTLYAQEYNKLVEVRKIEELARLRVVQNDIAQTQSLKKRVEDYKSQEEELKKAVDPIIIGDMIIDNPALIAKIKAEMEELKARGETTTPPTYEPLLPKPTFVLPNSPFYFLKSWGENINEFTSFGFEAKSKVKLAQAQERLAEAKALLEAGNESLANTTIEKYLGEVKEVVSNLKNNSSEEAKARIAPVVEQQAARDSLAVEQLKLSTSTHAQGSLLGAGEEVTNLLDVAADFKKETPLPEEVKAKIEALPSEMLPADKKAEILAVTTRSDAREKIGTLVEQGLILTEDYKILDAQIENLYSTEFSRVEELKKVQQIVEAKEAQKTLTEKITKNEDITKKLAEFQADFEPGDSVEEEIRPYVPLTRIDELTRTIRPDLVSLTDFPNRSDLTLAVASLQQEFKPTSEDLKRLEDFRAKKPTSALPPDLARIDALRFSLGVRTSAGPCYLPSPPFAPDTPCPPPGAPLSVVPTVSYNFASGQGGQNQVYGAGPKPVSSGVCPPSFHWMYDSGGWCMSDGGAYSSSGSVNANNTTYYSYSPVPNQGATNPYTSTFTSLYSPLPVSPYYNSTGGPSSYGQGPKPTAAGTCPEGFHWMGDSGGWCMSNGVSYTAPQEVVDPTQNLTQESCGPGYYWSGDKCYVNYSYNNSTYNNPYYNPTFVPSDPRSGAPYYYGPAPTTYTTTPPPGTTPGVGPTPVSPGVCPSGFHWMFSDGGWCMSDGPTYTPSSPGSWSSSGSCATGFYWNGNTCAATDPTVNLTQESCGPGYYWAGGKCYVNSSTNYNTTSSCGSGYYWTGSYCANSGSSGSGSGSGSTTTTGSCPAGYYWVYDSGGWCKSSSSGGSTTTYPTPTPTPTYPTPSSGSTGGSCPAGYHWMYDSGGWCMSDGGSGSSAPPSTSYPTPSYPTPSSTPEYPTPSYTTPPYATPEYPTPASTPVPTP